MKRITNIYSVDTMRRFTYGVVDVQSTGFTETEQNFLIDLFRSMILDARLAREAAYHLSDFECAHREGLANLQLRMERNVVRDTAFWTGVFKEPGKRLEIQSTFDVVFPDLNNLEYLHASQISKLRDAIIDDVQFIRTADDQTLISLGRGDICVHSVRMLEQLKEELLNEHNRLALETLAQRGCNASAQLAYKMDERPRSAKAVP